MRKSVFQAAAVLALLSAGEAQAAKVKQCLTRAEVHGMVAYFLPPLLEKTIESCGAKMPGNSFLRTRAPQLVGELTPGRAAAWPMARSAVLKFGDPGAQDDMAKLPDDLVKPIVEASITEMFGSKITAKNCADVDRILVPLAPLPGTNLVDAITEVFVVAARGDDEMPTCPGA